MGIFGNKGKDEKPFNDNRYRTQKDAVKDLSAAAIKKLDPQTDEGKRAAAERLKELGEK